MSWTSTGWSSNIRSGCPRKPRNQRILPRGSIVGASTESCLKESSELVRKLLTMVNDSDAKVRFQLLCTLGGIASAEARAARDQLLARDIEDKWFQIAALSASSDEAPRLFQKTVSSAIS